MNLEEQLLKVQDEILRLEEKEKNVKEKLKIKREDEEKIKKKIELEEMRKRAEENQKVVDIIRENYGEVEDENLEIFEKVMRDSALNLQNIKNHYLENRM